MWERVEWWIDTGTFLLVNRRKCSKQLLVGFVRWFWLQEWQKRVWLLIILLVWSIVDSKQCWCEEEGMNSCLDITRMWISTHKWFNPYPRWEIFCLLIDRQQPNNEQEEQDESHKVSAFVCSQKRTSWNWRNERNLRFSDSFYVIQYFWLVNWESRMWELKKNLMDSSIHLIFLQRSVQLVTTFPVRSCCC